jgi:C4-type Zn-finger protein
MKSTLLSKCAQCGRHLIAPDWSEHLSDRCVRNLWCCEACGCQSEETVYLSEREPREELRRLALMAT